MTVKKWAGIIVAAGIVGALGLEIWTFSEMIWQGFTDGQTPDSSYVANSSEDLSRFTYGEVEGHFKVLHLRANGEEWNFYCVLETRNPSDDNVHLTVATIRLQTGETIQLTEPIVLEPGVSRTVQFSRTVPPGTTPEAIKINQSSATGDQSRWFSLPKVPVKSG